MAALHSITSSLSQLSHTPDIYSKHVPIGSVCFFSFFFNSISYNIIAKRFCIKKVFDYLFGVAFFSRLPGF